MSMIKKISALEILDSRGNPTIEVELTTNKCTARASVPSGASTGIYEAHELRDNKKPYNGKGVLKAVNNIKKIIAPKLKGIKCTEQEKIDKIMIELDATENKIKLGANAILAVSIAACKAGAFHNEVPLYRYIAELSKNRPVIPSPFFNVINGGRHADNELIFQEFMIAPKAATFSKALRMGAETHHALKQILKKRFITIGVGDEGGFAPPIETPEEALKLLERAIEKAGYRRKIKIAIDAAASEFYKYGYYHTPKKHSSGQMVDYYRRLIKSYPIISIEDPFNQEDFRSFAVLKKKTKIQIVGDDLTATNPKRILRAMAENACNALLLKINQIGTITEALKSAELAKHAKWNLMVSNRSGETNDCFIADFAVGLGCRQIKAGAPCRGERLAKYNQLLRIEKQSRLNFAGLR